MIFNRTKIIATSGPSSESYDTLKELILAGVDVIRFNFSHGDYIFHEKVLKIVQQINRELNVYVSTMADLQGPKIRIGEVENNSVQLLLHAQVIFTTHKCVGTAEKIFITYPDFPKDVKAGDKVLIDDGKMELEVIATNRKDEVVTKVISGGILSSKKGVNLPNTKISIPSLTEKDKQDLDFALKNNFNWVALSFVRSADDIISLKEIIKSKNSSARVIAKIEKPEAIDNIDQIIDATDAVMVARGDLGVEIPVDQVPVCQKEIVKKSIQASKPVIIATQIMESMINNSTASRAEISDVANAVMDGADALMLSGETSVGKHPIKVIETINRIISTTEKQDTIFYKNLRPKSKSKTFLNDAICYNACKIAEDIKAKAIIGMTKSGYTAYMVSSYRPKAGIFIFTSEKEVIYALNLVWGVRAIYYNGFVSTEQTFKDVKKILNEMHLVKKDDIIVYAGIMPLHEEGRTNMIKVAKI